MVKYIVLLCAFTPQPFVLSSKLFLWSVIGFDEELDQVSQHINYQYMYKISNERIGEKHQWPTGARWTTVQLQSSIIAKQPWTHIVHSNVQ